jgi:TonB-linked SusC/RagA family outer membrane protein
MKKILLILLLFAFTGSVYAQTRTITGTVVSSDKNEPLVGVTVQVKGNTTAAQTDVNGKFAIKITNLQNVVLTVKYVGYSYQEHTLRVGENNLDVKLSPSTETNLEDVVVVGYGTQRKGSLTGAVSTVDIRKVEDIPALNLTTALRGTVAGLGVSGGTSRPGQPSTVTIRNPVAFAKDGGQGTNPLFVIDDIIRTQADFELLDQNEVETVTILKDAEAAVYGVRGGNGVILVRTKRGRQGAPKFSFASSLGFSNATQFPKMLNSFQLGTFMNDYYQTSLYQQTTAGVPVTNQFYNADGFKVVNGVPEATRFANWYTPDELDYFSSHSHEYLKEAFKTAYLHRSALNLSGGSDKVTYFIGADYVNQNSNFEGINSYKYGLRANLEAKPAKGLTVSVSISNNVSYNKSYWYKLTSTSESLDNDAGSLLNVQPWQEYFINGNPVVMGGSNTAGYDNLNFFHVQNSDNFTNSKSYVTNMLGKLTYEIPGVKGLSATFSMNKNINTTNSKQFGTNFLYYKYAGQGANAHIPGGNLLGTYTVVNGNKVRLNPSFSDNYQLDAGINYNRTFGKHAFAFLGLFEQIEQATEGVAAEVSGVVTGGLPYQTFATGTQASDQVSKVSQFGFQSIISRFNYAYDNKYLVQLVYRADGSSRFKPGNNWGGFPAASLAWVISQESFMKKYNWLDQLKVRASVGLTGSDNTKAYQYQANYTVGTGSNGGAVFNGDPRTVGIRANTAIPNENVVWDHFLKTDYGVDAQFLKGRLSLTADYFWTKGYDQLTTLSSVVPATIGASVPTENYAKVNTFGYEITLGWRDQIGKKFNYSFTPFFTWNDNKNILIDVAVADRGTELDVTGRSSNLGVYGYKSLGIIRTQAEADAIIAQRAAAAGGAQNVKIFNVPLQPGMINYQDVNNDGVISTDYADQQRLTKHSNNNKSLGLNFSVGYDALTLNVVAGMSWGGWASIDGIKPWQQSSSSTGASIASNRPVYWADHWTPTNTNAKYPAPYFQSNYQVTSDFWLVPGTTLNITSATLNYSIPTKWAKKVGMSSARVYATGTNLVQFLNPYPEKYRDQQTALYAYPSLRTVSFGLNVGF